MDHHNLPTMNQEIFKKNLDVGTVSLYLLCCSISDAGETISTKKIRGMWNSSEAALDDALRDLEDRNIIRKVISDREGNDVYHITNSNQWL